MGNSFAAVGTPFHGEFTSADASALSEANSRITLYKPGFTKNDAAITLTTSDQVIITDILIVAGAALTVQVYDGADATVDNGERIAQGNFAANGGASVGVVTPHYCKPGTWPKVKANVAGQVDVSIRGRIVNTNP